jgi:hypothetical protein
MTVVVQRFCQSASPAEAAEVLDGLNKRCTLLGIPPPGLAVVDNCCTVRNHLQKANPRLEVVLDVFHFLMRYKTPRIENKKFSLPDRI